MHFYPAIDLQEGKCIRLKKGILTELTVYNNNPVKQAQKFYESGSSWIHIVDIDGAFKGKSVNQDIIFKIKKNVNCKLQVGGGIRNIKIAEKYFENNIDRIVLGTIAIQNKNLVKEMCKFFPGRVAVGIDAKKGKVAINGWSKTSKISFLDLAKSYEDVGVSVVIFTDIDKDGVLEGVNIKQINELISSTSLKVISSGGVSSLENLKKIKEIKSTNLIGVISGRAIYEKRFSVKEAVELIEGR